MEEQQQLAETEDKGRTAPHPDHPAKPDSPAEVKPPAWGYVFKRSVAEFSTDQCTDLAAALTYFAVLSLFPGLLAVISLLGVFGQGQATTDWILQFMAQHAPTELVDLLSEPIAQLADRGGSGLALVTGLLGALWAASGYVGAFGRAMNRVYEIVEGRPFWKLRPMNLLVTVIVVASIVTVLGAFLLAGDVGRELNPGLAAVMGWASWPLAAALGVVMIAVLYYFTPNVQQPKFRWISLGAAIALFGMVVAAAGFAFYVANFSKYNAMYGTIGSVIVLLLGLWIMNNLLLFGAEFDAELERGRQLQAGIEAEETIQLPPRDTRQIDKRQEKADGLVDEARELRETNGESASDDDGAAAGRKQKSADPEAEAPGEEADEPRHWYADPDVRASLRMDDATPPARRAEPPS